MIADEDRPPLPFADEAFDLVVSRLPVITAWEEIARVLQPGGTYFSQQVVLAEKLQAADGDHRAAFAAYQRRMQDFVAPKQQIAIGNAKRFIPTTRRQIWLQNQTIKGTALPPPQEARPRPGHQGSPGGRQRHRAARVPSRIRGDDLIPVCGAGSWIATVTASHTPETRVVSGAQPFFQDPPRDSSTSREPRDSRNRPS